MSAPVVVRTVSSQNPSTPVPGVRVQIGSAPWLQTDANGEVRVSGVERPYTVQIFQTAPDPLGAATRNVWTRIGLTEAELEVRVYGSHLFDPACEVSGRITGRVPSGRISAFTSSRRIDVFDGRFDFSIEPTPNPVRLRAVEYDASQDRHLSYGQVEVSFPTDGPCRVQSIELPLAPVASRRLRGALRMPASLAPAAGSVSLHDYGVDTRLIDELEFSAGEAPRVEFEVEVFEVPDAQTEVVGQVMFPLRETSFANVFAFGAASASAAEVGGRQTVDFVLPAPVELLSPPDEAVLSEFARFEWRAAEDAEVYAWTANCSLERPNGRIELTWYRSIETTDTLIDLPDIPGLTLASGTVCVWSVRTQHEFDETMSSFSSAAARLFVVP